MDKKDIKYYLISCLILIPSIFFPIAADHSAFIQGGRVISDGGMIYSDFIDIKPPLIYYMFSFFEIIANNNTIIYRLFDYLFQCLFLFSAFKFLPGKVSDKRIVYLFSIIYAFSYVVLNDRNTMQVETFMVLPLLFYLSFSDIKKSNILIRGLALGIMISLKYTFGLVILAFPIYYLFTGNRSFKKVILIPLIELSISIFILFLIFLPVIFNSVSLRNFNLIIDFLSNYADTDYLSGDFIKKSFKSIGYFFGYLFSISLTFTFFFSIYDNKEKSKFWKLLLIAGLLLLITVMIELLNQTYILSLLFSLSFLQVVLTIYIYLSSRFGYCYLQH